GERPRDGVHCGERYALSTRDSPGLSHDRSAKRSSLCYFLTQRVVLSGDLFPRVVIPYAFRPHLAELRDPRGIRFESLHLACQHGLISRKENTTVCEHLPIEYR